MSKQDLIKQELEAIAEANNGLIRPQDVIEYARDEDTVLHSRFEWDDTAAAQEHRLWQARQVVRISLTVVEVDEGEYTTRAFVSLRTDRHAKGGYRTILDVMTDEDRRRQLMLEARQDFQLLQRKYRGLKELEPIFAEIEKLVTESHAPEQIPIAVD